MARTTRPRRTWHSLTPAQKRDRLAELRRHQQRDIEIELRMLTHGR